MSGPTTHDGVLVLRMWMEPHDRLMRCRLLSERSSEGLVATGVEAIVAAVRAELEAFERDASATDRRQHG